MFALVIVAFLVVLFVTSPLRGVMIKESANLTGLNTQIIVAIGEVREVYTAHKAELTITSGRDFVAGRTENSKHPQGDAVDFRLIEWPNGPGEESRQIVREIKVRLGRNFDVVLKTNHIHLEFDVRKLS